MGNGDRDREHQSFFKRNLSIHETRSGHGKPWITNRPNLVYKIERISRKCFHKGTFTGTFLNISDSSISHHETL